MHSPEQLERMEPLTAEEQQRFICAVRGLLPDLPSFDHDSQDTNLPRFPLAPAYIQHYKIGNGIVTAAEYLPYDDTDVHRIELVADTQSCLDLGRPSDIIECTTTTYYVEPTTRHSHYFQSQRLEGPAIARLDAARSPRIDTVRDSIRDVMEAARLAAETHQTIFTARKLSQALALIGECNPGNVMRS